MAVIISNEQEIDAPQPGQRRYGIFDASVSGALDEGMVASGIQFIAPDCGISVVPYTPVCEGTQPTKAFAPGIGTVDAKPYWLLASYQCGTVGTTADQVRNRVARRYNAGAQHAVENIIWNGGGGADPVLTTAGATIVTPSAPGAGAAVSALEEAFFDAHGYNGVIHVNTRAFGAVSYAEQADRQGGAGVLRTPLGNAWSFGAGYGITGPAGVAPAAGFVWAFITPQTYLWSTPVSQPDPVQTLDRSLNQWMALAETVYAHFWVCDTVFAVQLPIAAPAVATAPAVP